MLNKTFNKLVNRENKKPLHCIDTSVFLESTVDTKIGEICKTHLNNMGKGKFFRGIMPLSVLGEINLIVFRDIESPLERLETFSVLERFIDLRNINFIAQKKDDYLLIYELMETESRLDELDCEHIVCAKRAGANVFITLDSMLINNSTLEHKLGLVIKHPKEFI